jgi:hypothetical protein
VSGYSSVWMEAGEYVNFGGVAVEARSGAPSKDMRRTRRPPQTI